MFAISNTFSGREVKTIAMNNSSKCVELKGETLRQLQLTLLEMYRDIHRVCEKYNLSVFLGGGSALGAVRHQGFIPWDDDMDLNMTRSDFKVFTDVFKEELSDKYILNAPNVVEHPTDRFPKIMKKGTKLVEYDGQCSKENLNMVYIDIFLIENIPDNQVIRSIKGGLCNLCEFAISQIEVKENWSFLKEIYLTKGKLYAYSKFFLGCFLGLIPHERWINTLDRIVQCNNSNTIYCGFPTGRKHYFGEIHQKDNIFPGSEWRFEGEKVTLPNKADIYLKMLYGEDYMELPPENKREHHYVKEIKL